MNWQELRLDLAGVGGRALAVLAILLGGLVLHRLGRRVIRAAGNRTPTATEDARRRSETARGLLLSTWKYVVLFGVGAALLALLPHGLIPAAALVGAGSLIVGLGVQSLFRDVLAGFSIVLEGQFSVGDRVRLLGVDIEGTVEAIGLRVTVVREETGSRTFVPNGAITAVRNLTGADRERPVVRRSSRRGRTPTDDAPERRTHRQGDAARPSPASDRPADAGAADETGAPLEGDAGNGSARSDERSRIQDQGEGGGEATAARRRSRRGGRRRGGRRRTGDGAAATGDASSSPTPSGGESAPAPTPQASSPRAPTPQTPPRPVDAPTSDDRRGADVEPREVLDESPWPIE